jgi:hypothetical protein
VIVPRRAVRKIIVEPAGVMMADMPVVVRVLDRRMGVLRFSSLTLGPLPYFRHDASSFRGGD